MNKNKRVWALVLSIVMFVSAWVSLISKFVSMGIHHSHNQMTASRVNINQTTCDDCGETYNNGFCACFGVNQLQEPVLVTAENREALGLGEEYLNYRAITNAGELFWFSIYSIDDYVQEIYIDNYGVIMNDISVNGTKDQTNVKNCGGNKQIGWTDFNFYLYDYFTITGKNLHMSLSHYVLDGRGYTISGVYHSGNTGLFGRIQPNQDSPSSEKNEIKNLGIVNSYFGGGGAFSSLFMGNITNCYSDSTVYGPMSVIGVGGLVGILDLGVMRNCYNLGNVTSTDAYAGGLVGFMEAAEIINCYNLGDVYSESANGYAGGLVGHYCPMYGCALTNCYSVGNVGTNSENKPGGLIGLFSGGTNEINKITNCYYNSEKSAEKFIGAFSMAEISGYSGVVSKTTEEFASGEVAYLLNGSSSAGVWKQNIGEDMSPNFTASPVYKTKEYECDGTTFIKEYYSNLNDNYVHDHDYKFVEAVDPNFETQTDGYDLYVCENNETHERKDEISWTTLGATISFEENGGVEIQDILLKKGTVVSDFTKPTRKGYEFAGWHYESYLQTKVGGSLTLESDITLYAKWIKCDHEENVNAITCEKGCNCSVCGEELPAHGHSGDWTVTKEATALAEGEQKRICSICGKEQVETIPKVYSKAEPEVKVEEKKERSATDIITIISTAIGAVGAGGAGLGTIVARIGKVFRKRKFGL